MALTGVQGPKAGSGHAILGLPLFVGRFTHASRATGEAWFSGLLGEAGCQGLGLLDEGGAAPPPASGDVAPAGAAPAPQPAVPASGARQVPGCGVGTALIFGLVILVALQWL